MSLRDFINKNGSSVLASGSSVIGSGLNLVGTVMTNNTNREIANANNQTMIDMAREQTRSEQNYNSIGAQMQRAMAAGVHPQLLAGAQPTSASSASVPSLDTPTMQNPFANFNVGGSAWVQASLQEKALGIEEKKIGIQEAQTTQQMIGFISDLLKNENLTGAEVQNIITAVMGNSSPKLGTFARDNLVTTQIRNKIEKSNIDTDTARYLYSWLDEMTNAQFTNLLADTEQKQTQSNVNRSIASLNAEKKNQVIQGIKNMEEQWKSLNFQGEFDAHKLKHVVELTNSFIKNTYAESRDAFFKAGVSELDFRNYMMNKFFESSKQFGAAFGAGYGLIDGYYTPSSSYNYD